MKIEEGRPRSAAPTESTDNILKAEINLYYDVKRSYTRAPLLIALHGYGASKRHMMREAQLILAEHSGRKGKEKRVKAVSVGALLSF